MKALIFVLASSFIAMTGPARAEAPDVKHYSAGPDMPFSDAVRVDNMLYLSGKLGNIPGTSNLAEGGIAGETRQALEQNNLQVARAAFMQIPAANSNNSEVIAVKKNLRAAVDQSVTELVATGDSLYRADNVLEALKHWNEAKSLDPENHALQERIDRANKVLARLEELKRQQP